jgi:NADPH-dependent glutamate synthase beta subunit-like oxidoreductase
MNRKVLAIAPIVAVAALVLTAVGFATPQQALAHNGQHYHNHSSNSIKVDQQINQLNNCTLAATCDNQATNDVVIHR